MGLEMYKLCTGTQERMSNSRSLLGLFALSVFFSLLVTFPLALSGSATPALAEEDLHGQLSKSPSHSVAQLEADVKQVKAGVPFKVGVKISMIPGWHTYYKESGDAGMPTTIKWTLPEGFTASDLLWEKPSKFVDAGITTYGYHEPSLTAAVITPPANFSGPVKISALVKWLCCRDICIPGKAQLDMELPVTTGTPEPSLQKADFDKLGWQGKVTDLAAAPEGKPADNNLSVASQNSNSGSGGPGGANVGTNSTTPTAALSDAAVGASSSLLDEKLDVQGQQQITLPLCFLFAFIGGFILNFMPCVLPVIALKVVSIVEQAHGDRSLVQRHAVSFTAGMIGTFLLLAAVVLAVQAAGGGVGWGFLFQIPAFILGMSVVVLLFSLSLFGMFYISLPNQGSVDSLASRNDLVGTFFKGVLATVLSTPCTAPFLGTALGFAFTQNAFTILLIFLTIGIGMASPYFVLMLRPDLLKFMPKPGTWMERFKESMGFILLATVVWLLSILGQTTGVDGLVRAITLLVAVSFAAWLMASFTNLSSSGAQKGRMWALSLAVVAGTFYFTYGALPGFGLVAVKRTGASGERTGPIVWQPYDLKQLDTALQAKRTVLVDFTADWCLTCKVNEKTVLDSKEVTDKLQELKVVTMQADWTNGNAEISKILAKFNRSGVPLYIIFPGKNPTKPIVLPEVITKDLVIKALDEAGASS
jgi:thiol:disulfide interchange protein